MPSMWRRGSLLYCSVLLLGVLSSFANFGTTAAETETELNDAADDDPSTWPGHLEPLGARNLKHNVATVDDFPTPKQFFSEYVVPSKPLLIKDGAKQSTAFKLWHDDYLLSLPGAENTTVFVEQRKKENRTYPGYEMNFRDFMKQYNDSDIYMVNGVPDILQKDVILPPPLLCEDVQPLLVDTVMWFSSGGTKSVFHHDDVDNINCLYRGSKTLLFVEYNKYKSKLRLDNAWGGFSAVDTDRVDFTKYPIFREVEFYEAKMEAGDCLFIPYKWYHQVISIGSNIAVNVWWTHSSSFVPSKCDDVVQGATLDQFKFSSLAQEKYSQDSGNGEEQEGQGLLDEIGNLIKRGKELSFDDFVSLLKQNIESEVKPELDHDVLDFIGHVFQTADSNKDGVISADDFNNITEQALSQLENDLSELEGILGEYHDPMYVHNMHEEL